MSSDFEHSMALLAKDFDTVWSTLHRERMTLAEVLADPEADKWKRIKAVNRIAELDRAEKALVNIMGATEDSCDRLVGIDQDFLPRVTSKLL